MHRVDRAPTSSGLHRDGLIGAPEHEFMHASVTYGDQLAPGAGLRASFAAGATKCWGPGHTVSPPGGYTRRCPDNSGLKGGESLWRNSFPLALRLLLLLGLLLHAYGQFTKCDLAGTLEVQRSLPGLRYHPRRESKNSGVGTNPRRELQKLNREG